MIYTFDFIFSRQLADLAEIWEKISGSRSWSSVLGALREQLLPLCIVHIYDYDVVKNYALIWLWCWTVVALFLAHTHTHTQLRHCLCCVYATRLLKNSLKSYWRSEWSVLPACFVRTCVISPQIPDLHLKLQRAARQRLYKVSIFFHRVFIFIFFCHFPTQLSALITSLKLRIRSVHRRQVYYYE